MKEKSLSNENPSRGLRREAGIIDEVAVEPVAQEVVEETPKNESKVGIVDNCVKLNLRSEPKLDARNENVITELLAGSVVVIDEEKSTDSFYKVTTETGREGYCMKSFIGIIK